MLQMANLKNRQTATITQSISWQLLPRKNSDYFLTKKANPVR